MSEAASRSRGMASPLPTLILAGFVYMLPAERLNPRKVVLVRSNSHFLAFTYSKDDQLLVVISGGVKCHLPFVALPDMHEVVGITQIKLGAPWRTLMADGKSS